VPLTKIILFVQPPCEVVYQPEYGLSQYKQDIKDNTGLIHNTQLTRRSQEGSHVALAVWFGVSHAFISTMKFIARVTVRSSVFIVSIQVSQPDTLRRSMEHEVLWGFHPAMLGPLLTHQ
jgi:hypothetical protein